MKKIKIKSENVKAFIAISVVISIIIFAAYKETKYTRTGQLYRVGTFEYEFTDITGHEWVFYTDDIIADETEVKVWMDTKGTPTYIYDDAIIDYKIISETKN